MSPLERLGWNRFFEQQVIERVTNTDRSRLLWARVVEEQRGLYRIAGDAGGWAEVSGRFRHDAKTAADFPAVGDWVGIRVAGSGLQVPGAGSEAPVALDPSGSRAIIHVRLERRSEVSRAAAGRAVDQQVVAANVDTIFVVTALTRDLNPRRLERYVTMIWDAGAVPVVVLNKADLSGDPEGESASIRTRLPHVDVVWVSALKGDGLEVLSPYLRPAQTVALLGSSGVGKSTLVNRLLGGERDNLDNVQRVGAIRESDGRGRHTTTSRQLVELPGGALLIDTPGMRELQLWSDEAAVDRTFDDIGALARDCRFDDCAHEAEPGCAVREAVAAGRLDEDRLANYRRLLREAAFEARKRDKGVAAEEKRRGKQGARAVRALYRDRDRR